MTYSTGAGSPSCFVLQRLRIALRESSVLDHP